jgi:hypothetical protein
LVVGAVTLPRTTNSPPPTSWRAARGHGVDSADAIEETLRWEKIMAAVLTLLLRKHHPRARLLETEKIDVLLKTATFLPPVRSCRWFPLYRLPSRVMGTGKMAATTL